jgi:hypothetical protein
MAPMTLKSILAGIALVSTLAASASPARVNADQRIGPDGRPIPPGTVVSNGRPTVAIDNIGPGRSNQDLGIHTHWECATALDNANDPFTSVRTPDVRVSTVASATVSIKRVPNTGSGFHAAGLARTGPKRRYAIDPVTSCTGNTGGIKIYSEANFPPTAYCARFTGTGYLWLRGVNYPSRSTSVGNTASALATLGSSGHGELLCPNANSFPFNSNSQYSYIGDACNDNVDWLVSN